MKNRTLSLSLLIAAALAIPSVAMAAPAKKSMPVTAKTATADSTLQTKTPETGVENTDSERASTQANAVEISETKTFSRSRASTNQQNTTAAVAETAELTEAETLQNSPKESQEALQNPEKDMQDSQEDMQP